jgi:Cu+-exporting ATPase
MWPFKKKVQGETLKIKISGMHCSSCAMNIDNSIEEIPGVLSSKTNYAKGETEVVFAPGKSVQSAAKKAIEKLGYKVI